MQWDGAVTEGTVLNCGQTGMTHFLKVHENRAGGGGGGTFVADENNCDIVAGGGNGDSGKGKARS